MYISNYVKFIITILFFSTISFANNSNINIDPQNCIDTKICPKILEIKRLDNVKPVNKNIVSNIQVSITNKSKKNINTILAASYDDKKVNCGQFFVSAKSTITVNLSCNVSDVAYLLGDKDGRSNFILISKYTIEGTLLGLSSGETVVIKDTNAGQLSLNTNSSFVFPSSILDGSSYNITIVSSPTEKVCVVENNSGIVSGANITNINVKCIESHVYITDQSASKVTKCKVDNNEFYNCSQAVIGLTSPTDVIIIESGSSHAYISNLANNIISKCEIQLNGDMDCTPLNESGTPLQSPSGLALNPVNSKLYITNFFPSYLSKCTFEQRGSKINCLNTGNSFQYPTDIIFNSSGKYAYVTNFLDNTLLLCQVNNSDGSLTCANALTNSSSYNFNRPYFMAFNHDETVLYVSNWADGSANQSKVSKCIIDSDGNLTCSDAVTGLDGVTGIAFNRGDDYIYLTSFTQSKIYRCTILVNDNLSCSFITANGATLNSPANLAFNYGTR